MTSRAGSPSEAARAQAAEANERTSTRRPEALASAAASASTVRVASSGSAWDLTSNWSTRSRGAAASSSSTKSGASPPERPGAAQLGGRALVRPSLEVRAEQQPRVVQQHEPAVRGQAHVALQPVGVRGKRARQRGPPVVGPVGAAEPVRVQRDHPDHSRRLDRAKREDAENVRRRTGR
jgi:hypothetical protein